MKRFLERTERVLVRPVALWFKSPLASSVSGKSRLRFYALLLLLVCLSVPLLHVYLDVSLSFVELAVHTLSIVLATAVVLLLTELVVGSPRKANWNFQLSTGGFWLRALVGYPLALGAMYLIHDFLPFTRMILEKHSQAGHTNMPLKTLPVLLLVVYILYQVLRKNYLMQQIEALKQINLQLDHVKSKRREGAGQRIDDENVAYSGMSVKHNGVELTLDPASIVRIQADENYCHVVVNASPDKGAATRYLVRITLSEAIDSLPDRWFVQTHRSYVVNLLHVAEIIRYGRRCELRLTNGDRVPVSRARTKSVQSTVREFLAAAC